MHIGAVARAVKILWKRRERLKLGECAGRTVIGKRREGRV